MDPATINNLLLFAIAFGVLLIVLAMLLNVYQGLRNRDWEKAFFSNNGVAGLVFYGAVLAGAVSSLTGGPNLFTLPYILAFVVLPILIIFLKEPLGEIARGHQTVSYTHLDVYKRQLDNTHDFIFAQAQFRRSLLRLSQCSDT